MRTQGAEKVEPAGHEVVQDVGKVTRRIDGRFVVDCEGATYRATRAVSCLVEPELGDQVLVAGKPSGDLYVLAILERPGSSHVVVGVPGDLTLRVDAGRFAVAARSGVDLISSTHVALTSPEVEVRAKKGTFSIDQLELLGRRVFADVEVVKSVTKRFERVAEQVIERMKRSYRFVEGTEHVRAGALDYVAEETLRLKGENAFVQADLLVKVDGDQIHLG